MLVVLRCPLEYTKQEFIKRGRYMPCKSGHLPVACFTKFEGIQEVLQGHETSSRTHASNLGPTTLR